MAKLITGTAGQDTILGTQAADSIQAGAGSDLIYGFMGADTIDGGTGYDTLFISGTTLDLNTAKDAQLISVEEVSAKLSNGGVTINLGNQSEGFILTGSAYKDILTGGQGTNSIDAGDGDDTIFGFGASDTVNGGIGVDTLVLSSSISDATDVQLSNIENILASGADKGLTINLGKQSERFYLIASSFADDVTGGFGADVINTGAGDDKIHGFLGNDFINGGDGTDTLLLGKTSVYLNAALDVQLINVEKISAVEATYGVIIDLSNQSEGFTITGSDYSDSIKGGSGSDTIIGSSGVDTIDGGFGADTLVLTSSLINLTNAQLVNVESIDASSASEGLVINLGAQNERLNITGSSNSDTVTGSIGIDVISAGGGDDIIKGFASADTIDGGAGFDSLILTSTSANLNSATDAQLINFEAISATAATTGVNMTLTSQTERFLIIGSNYSDTLKGGAGADSISGFNGSDFVDGGKGLDTLFLQASSANLNGADDAQVANVEAISAINATAGVNIILVNQSEGFSIIGGAYADQLTGTAQEDTFVGFAGADTINGGASLDTIQLTATSADLNRASNAQIVNIEKISAAAATTGVLIDVSGQTERLQIIGGAGNDSIIGGAGSDNLTGGAGADHFIFNGPVAANSSDLITDFTPTVDSLDLNHDAFTALGSVGQLQAGIFWSSPSDTSAHSANDRLIYNTTTGALYYDADGQGGAAAIQVATFINHPQLTSNYVFII